MDYRIRADRPDELKPTANAGDVEASQRSSEVDEKIYEDPTPADGLNQRSLLAEEVENQKADPHPIEGAWIVSFPIRAHASLAPTLTRLFVIYRNRRTS